MNNTDFLLAQTNEYYFAVAADKVIKVLPRAAIVPVPNAPGGVLGLLYYEQTLYVVFGALHKDDFRIILSEENRAYSAEHIHSVIHFSDEELNEAFDMPEENRTVEKDGRLVHIYG